MKTLLFIFFFIFCCLEFTNLHAQKIQFETFRTNPGFTDYPLCSIEDDAQNIIFITGANNMSNSTDNQLCITKINKDGDTLKIKYLDTHTHPWMVLSDIIQLDNGNFMAMGDTVANNEVFLWFVIFDPDLNILSTVKHYFRNYLIVKLKAKFDHDRNIIACGYFCFMDSLDKCSSYIMKVSQTGELLKLRAYTEYIGGLRCIKDLLVKPDSTGYLMFGRLIPDSVSGYTEILHIDTAFNIIAVDQGPFSLVPFNNQDVQWLTDSTFLLAGVRKVYGNPNQNDDLGIYIMNDTGAVFFDNHFGLPDTIDYPAWNKAMDFVGKDKIYLVGMTDVVMSIYLPQYYNSIIINNVDDSLNLNWQYFYGFDAYYEVKDILATRDGGCFIMSFRYDYLTQVEQEWDLHILKIMPPVSDTTDTTNIVNNQINKPKSFLLYPNPGKDKIFLQGGLDCEKIIELFDIRGCLVLKEHTMDRQINTSNLPCGLYQYRIICGNIIQTGRWIKY